MKFINNKHAKNGGYRCQISGLPLAIEKGREGLMSIATRVIALPGLACPEGPR